LFLRHTCLLTAALPSQIKALLRLY
jgi:hypothetical protein